MHKPIGISFLLILILIPRLIQYHS